MTVSDFDSNGLIFALCESASSENGEPYRSAVRNIMDAQGFDIMPLVDAPRIRTNVNDMTARAVYAKKGGNITHLAQRFGDSVELFTMDQILTVKENESIFHALVALCSHMLEHPSTPFVLMVVDSNNNPTALFSLRELLSRRLNDAILSTYLGYSAIKAGNVEKKSKAIHDLLELFQKLQEAYQNYWHRGDASSREAETIALLCSAVSKQLRLFSNATISLPRRRQSPPRTDDADVHLIDVMRHGAAGVIWDGKNGKIAQLACHILCEANDFDFLVQYDSKDIPDSLNRLALMDRKGERHRISSGYKNFNDTLFDSLEKLFLYDSPLFIAPSNDIETGEGALVWPSILSFEEVKNSHGALWLMKQLVECEDRMRALLPDREFRISENPGRPPRERDFLTMGQINTILSGKGVDTLGVKKMKPEYILSREVINWRNDFAHGMRNNALRLGGLSRRQITDAVRCCVAWKSMKEKDVQEQ